MRVRTLVAMVFLLSVFVGGIHAGSTFRSWIGGLVVPPPAPIVPPSGEQIVVELSARDGICFDDVVAASKTLVDERTGVFVDVLRTSEREAILEVKPRYACKPHDSSTKYVAKPDPPDTGGGSGKSATPVPKSSGRIAVTQSPGQTAVTGSSGTAPPVRVNSAPACHDSCHGGPNVEVTSVDHHGEDCAACHLGVDLSSGRGRHANHFYGNLEYLRITYGVSPRHELVYSIGTCDGSDLDDAARHAMNWAAFQERVLMAARCGRNPRPDGPKP